MLKNYILVSLFALGILLQSCNDFKKTDSGVKYKIIEDSTGDNAKVGDLVVFEVQFQNEIDSFDTKKAGRPATVRVDSIDRGGLEDVLKFVSKGDSLAVMVSNDSLYKNQFKADTTVMKKIKPGSFTTFYLKITEVYTPERLKQEQEKYRKQEAEMMKQKVGMGVQQFKSYKKEIVDSSKAQMAEDDKKIQAYLKKKGLKGTKTENGVYVVIQKQGEGEQAAPGDSVKITYVGKLLNDKEFDKSSPANPYLSYMLSLGQLIPGIDEGIEQLKNGASASIIIPSALAYGKEGRKDSPNAKEYKIPPSSPLVFDVQLIEVKKWR